MKVNQDLTTEQKEYILANFEIIKKGKLIDELIHKGGLGKISYSR